MTDEALPKLKEALQDKNLAQQAASAMGNIGKESIPILIDMLKNGKKQRSETAAAEGARPVGALHGDPAIIPPLLDMLFRPLSDMNVRTEVGCGRSAKCRISVPWNRTQARSDVWRCARKTQL